MKDKKIKRSKNSACPGCGKEFDDIFSNCLITCSCGKVYMLSDIKPKNGKKAKK